MHGGEQSTGSTDPLQMAEFKQGSGTHRLTRRGRVVREAGMGPCRALLLRFLWDSRGRHVTRGSC